MKTFLKIRGVTDKILNGAILALFLTMFGITVINVIARFVFHSPLGFAVELGRYTFAGIVYLGSIFVMRNDGHIGLDIIVDALPGALSGIVKKLSRVLVLGYMVLFCAMSVRMVATNWGNRSSAMHIPMSIIYMVMVIGSAGMFVEELLLLIGVNNPHADAEEAGGGM